MSSENHVLVTGAAGFIGAQLVPALAAAGYRVIALDRLPCAFAGDRIVPVICDLLDAEAVARVFAEHRVSHVVHLATELNIVVKSQKELYRHNIAMTENLVRAARSYPLEGFVFTSSFAIYSGLPGDRPIVESVRPASVDEYGASKIVCEGVIEAVRSQFPCAVLRCPLVVGGGRVGMLSILFDIISRGHPLFVIKRGRIRHHCIATRDTLEAIKLCVARPRSVTINLGSEEVRTFREIFEDLIAYARSRSKIIEIGSWWTIPVLRLLFLLKLSPLGPHQFRMLTDDCVLDTGLARRELGWRAGVGHLEMMREAYDEFVAGRGSKEVVSANSRPVKARILNLLRFFG